MIFKWVRSPDVTRRPRARHPPQAGRRHSLISREAGAWPPPLHDGLPWTTQDLSLEDMLSLPRQVCYDPLHPILCHWPHTVLIIHMRLQGAPSTWGTLPPARRTATPSLSTSDRGRRDGAQRRAQGLLHKLQRLSWAAVLRTTQGH